uniref:Uncharacterized protein n=1 Tax=Arundo donax TaxID=35708 RepID=A0A0A9A8B8_ARUDO
MIVSCCLLLAPFFRLQILVFLTVRTPMVWPLIYGRSYQDWLYESCIN